jgi:3-phosphoshikimate 1-carboxyvinyltransferase
MNKSIKLHSTSKKIEADIVLGGSKSITNRALLIRALCSNHFDIQNISLSDDSEAMEKILSQTEGPYDAGHAGTTFRFLTAYFAFKDGTQIMTGSDRMKQRPIGPLVDALNHIGANITYAENHGFPPLVINAPSEKIKNEVSIKADVSSQYLSALLMLAPTLPSGLNITLEGELVSRPYLEMTLTMMQTFGVSHIWEGNTISIRPQAYIGTTYFVEADWSSASYLYSWAAIAEEAEITISGLFLDSMQGDAAIMKIAESFGVNTKSLNGKLIITKSKSSLAIPFFEYDFIQQPDIAQTVFTMCAACGVQGLFTGLQTLSIKETDRIAAFKTELSKIGILISKVPPRFKKKDERIFYMLNGELNFEETPAFDTYHDHRMAMALAPLAMLNDIKINDADVVSKSYPNYWEDIRKMGVTVI